MYKTNDISSDPYRLYERTFFNREAFVGIHTEEFPLNVPGTTAKLQVEKKRREVNEFPPDSIAVKTFWRVVPENDNPRVPVGIWQWPTEYKDPLLESQWKKPEACIQVKPEPGSGCLQPESAFVTATVKNEDEYKCEKCPQLSKGTRLILIGLHIASKEKPDWLWATFWWKGGVDKDGNPYRTDGTFWTCDNAQRGKIEGVWGNYSMNVASSLKLQRSEPLTDEEVKEASKCGLPGKIMGEQYLGEDRLAVYNPFVEGVITRGLKSNCIVCHVRASTNNRDDFGVGRSFVPELGKTESPTIKYFEGHVRTDYMWTVTKHLAPTPLPNK
jgi:hypothetical protein